MPAAATKNGLQDAGGGLVDGRRLEQRPRRHVLDPRPRAVRIVAAPTAGPLGHG
jgi:hypothetical protein